MPRLVYHIMILNTISQYILSTGQDDWSGVVVNKLHSVKPVLGDRHSSYRRCRKDDDVLSYPHRSYAC